MSVKELKTIRYKGKEYFVDNRLEQLRPVLPPFRILPFDSKEGNEIFDSLENPEPDIYRVTCKNCGSIYRIELVLIGQGARKLSNEFCHYCQSEDIKIIPQING